MELAISITLALTFLLLVSYFCSPSYLLREYWRRSCQGRAWRRQFPNAPNEDIRQFLSLLANSFLVDQKRRLQFSPNDRLLGIYRTIYPNRFVVDTCELEHFVIGFKQRYNIDLLPIWRETLSLGELFALTRAA